MDFTASLLWLPKWRYLPLPKAMISEYNSTANHLSILALASRETKRKSNEYPGRWVVITITTYTVLSLLYSSRRDPVGSWLARHRCTRPERSAESREESAMLTMLLVPGLDESCQQRSGKPLSSSPCTIIPWKITKRRGSSTSDLAYSLNSQPRMRALSDHSSRLQGR